MESFPAHLLLLLWLVAGVSSRPRIVTVGGGAAGYFAAIEAATLLRRHSSDCEVVVLEAARETLQKVLISGGGRCNVMHDPSKGAAEISKGYPRGGKELLSPFNAQFGPSETFEWFSRAGIELKTEADGRVFPRSDRSATIIAALEQRAEESGVRVRCGCSVLGLRRDDDSSLFTVQYSSSQHGERRPEELTCDAVIMATGSSRLGHGLLRDLGHRIESPVPSLFSFKIGDDRLRALAGVSAQRCEVRLIVPPDFSKGPHKALVRPNSLPLLRQGGAVLVTHQGLSGPAVLRLSAFGARVLAAMQYNFKVEVNWLPRMSQADVLEHMSSTKTLTPSALVTRAFPSFNVAQGAEDALADCIPKRLWVYLLEKAGIPQDKKWADLSTKELSAMATEITSCSFTVEGNSALNSLCAYQYRARTLS